MVTIRTSGILMHISSLPSPYGIGTMGKSAYEFVDFLCDCGQKYWQILPIGPTTYGDSPYQSLSTFAGNPYFIDFDILSDNGLLNSKDYIKKDWGDNVNSVDYKKLFDTRYSILKIAFDNYINNNTDKMNLFREQNADWIEDYALFMALKYKFGGISWMQWDNDIKLRKPNEIKKWSIILKEDIDFWVFVQYQFFKQWNNLKNYANKNGIEIIGDIPIYVAQDSSDVWANPHLFQLDDNMNPIEVSGCPPDAFSEDGQLWGNPLYRWDLMKDNEYNWWIKRIKSSTNMYDILRIDHFRGFESFYTIPYGDKTAKNGMWKKGPGIDFFNVMKQKIGDKKIIAEDLGYLTDSVRLMLKQSGYPGMKVLQFAFDSREESDYLPHNYQKNCIVYTGTHDNDTAKGWFNTAPKADVEFCKNYLKLTHDEGYNWGFIRAAWSSVGNVAIAQMQDFLNLSSEARMNIPSTIGQNWKWRALLEYFTKELSSKILSITKLYGRGVNN